MLLSTKSIKKDFSHFFYLHFFNIIFSLYTQFLLYILSVKYVENYVDIFIEFSSVLKTIPVLFLLTFYLFNYETFHKKTSGLWFQRFRLYI